MPRTFDVVFRGGGVKGIAFSGGLTKLVEAGHTTRRLIGTSAGAIFAASWAIGYKPAEIEAKVLERVDDHHVFSTFLATTRRPEWAPELIWKPIAGAADNAVRRLAGLMNFDKDKAAPWGGRSLALTLGGAACDDSAFREWMGGILKAKEVDPETTLKELHPRIMRIRPQQINLIAADISHQQVLVLNERTAPDLPILDAIRMSMGIPFIWKEVQWKRAWGEYRGQEMAGHLVVDGGLLSNFPIKYFLDPDFSKPDGLLGPFDGKAEVLGFLLDGRKPIPDLPELKDDTYLVEYLPPIRTASRLLDTLLDAADLDAVRQWIPRGKEGDYLCRIGTRGVGSLEFDMPEDRMKALVNSGRCAMTEFLVPTAPK